MSGSREGGDEIHPRATAVLKYWLGEDFASQSLTALPEAKTKLWFGGGPEVDKEIVTNFGEDVEKAAAGEYHSWREGYNGLAAVLLMDQFSRNVYRGQSKTFDLDEGALGLAKAIEAGGSTAGFPAIHRVWLYMPLMHSERLEDQQECVQRFQTLEQEVQRLPDSDAIADMIKNNVEYAKAHLDVIAKWGRFPHRNELLGRRNTPEEEAGLGDGSIPKF